MFEPLLTAGEMRAAEEAFPGFPDTAGELMERAGRGVANVILTRFPGVGRVAVVCGGGSNGGDGRVVVRELREAGIDAEETRELGGADLIVDALFGTGFAGPPRPEAAALIERINSAGVPVVAIDLPSGVDASTGEVPGAAVLASVTVTFHAEKVGHVIAPGRFHAGEVVVADIGLAPDSTSATRRLTPAVLDVVPLRGARDSKYSAGSVCVVGGSPGMIGAAVLAARAALRADAGYVTLCVPDECLAIAETLALEPVKVPFSSTRPEVATEVVLAASARSGAVVLGPGLGRNPGAGALVRALLAALEVPVVLDADGLAALASADRGGDLPERLVLTPHAGELGRLLGREAPWIDAHRLAAAREAAGRFRATVLLKGPDTIVVEPGEVVLVSDCGPPGLATAGTGDVLAGVLGAFLAKGLRPGLAAGTAALAHGLAAGRAGQQAGLIASDVVEALPPVLGRTSGPA